MYVLHGLIGAASSLLCRESHILNPTWLCRYKLGRKLGMGGQATVYAVTKTNSKTNEACV